MSGPREPGEHGPASSRWVRAATAADAAEAIAVVRASIIELCVDSHQNDEDTLTRWLSNKTTEHFLRWLASPDNFMVVSEDATGLSGVGSINRKGELNLCYVRPGRQRCGVGRAMLLELEARARHFGLAEIRLTSSVSARPFYERHGYLSAGEPFCECGVRWDYPYGKSLAAFTAEP